MHWKDILDYSLIEFGGFDLLVGELILAVIIIFITWGIMIALKRAILRPRFIIDKIDSKRRMSIYLITKYILWVISILLILEVVGAKITVLIFGSTAILVGLGFGLQDIFKDVVSGLFLLFEGSIKIGDVIEADGEVGKVVDINLRSSEIKTRDDVSIIIPNSRFVVEKVVNWSHGEEIVRFTVNVSVAYGSDVEKVFDCLGSTMHDNPSVVNNPKPFVRFTNFGESSLDFEMIFWSKDAFGIDNLKSDLRREVYKRLKENDLVIPFPQRDVHIKGMEKFFEKGE